MCWIFHGIWWVKNSCEFELLHAYFMRKISPRRFCHNVPLPPPAGVFQEVDEGKIGWNIGRSGYFKSLFPLDKPPMTYMITKQNPSSLPGWWFQTCVIFHFIYIYGIIIIWDVILAIDELIFFTMVGIPPSSSPVQLNPMNCQEVTFPLTQSLRWTSARCGEVGLGSHHGLM